MYRWSTYLLLRLHHSVSCTCRQEAECSTWEQQHTADKPACILQTPPLSSHHSQYKLSQCRKQDALYLSNPLRLDPTLPTDPRDQIILSGHARLANQPRGRRVTRLILRMEKTAHSLISGTQRCRHSSVWKCKSMPVNASTLLQLLQHWSCHRAVKTTSDAACQHRRSTGGAQVEQSQCLGLQTNSVCSEGQSVVDRHSFRQVNVFNHESMMC